VKAKDVKTAMDIEAKGCVASRRCTTVADPPPTHLLGRLSGAFRREKGGGPRPQVLEVHRVALRRLLQQPTAYHIVSRGIMARRDE